VAKAIAHWIAHSVCEPSPAESAPEGHASQRAADMIGDGTVEGNGTNLAAYEEPMIHSMPLLTIALPRFWPGAGAQPCR